MCDTMIVIRSSCVVEVWSRFVVCLRQWRSQVWNLFVMWGNVGTVVVIWLFLVVMLGWTIFWRFWMLGQKIRRLYLVTWALVIGMSWRRCSI